MYELTKKELRKKFGETEYGKKVNKYFKISLIVFIISILIPFGLGFVHGLMGTSEEVAEKTLENIEPFMTFLIDISLVFAIYFDGKRDGAISQFKKSIDSKK